jgi:hypothetical protein
VLKKDEVSRKRISDCSCGAVWNKVRDEPVLKAFCLCELPVCLLSVYREKFVTAVRTVCNWTRAVRGWPDGRQDSGAAAVNRSCNEVLAGTHVYVVVLREMSGVGLRELFLGLNCIAEGWVECDHCLMFRESVS